jgi:queuine tRNA-ribosyltransferase
MALSFSISSHSSVCRARVGRVVTKHGAFDTPAFMPVGTRGTVKGILPHLLAETGAQICLGNTYHLLLRPGPETVAALGGLQVFTGWNRPMLTDSGGYQAYSMANINSISDEGVTFKSIVDGATVHLSPERATAVQNTLGADIIMAFDDCPPSMDAAAADEGEPAAAERSEPAPAQPEARLDPRLDRVLRRDKQATKSRKGFDHAARLKEANERTVRWLERCKAAHLASGRAGEQSLFGIVQGGTDFAQRTWSAERICNIELPGYAIGGVAVGETSADIARVVRHTAPLLPESKPRYLMGVGYERDIVAAVMAGVDMFDCVLPTRNGRNANAFTPAGQMRLRNAKFSQDTQPIWPGCDCHACRPDPVTGRHFSRGYLRHLFMADEMLGPILVTLHNLRHFQRLTADLRATIPGGDWQGFTARWPVCAEAVAAGLAAS